MTFPTYINNIVKSAINFYQFQWFAACSYESSITNHTGVAAMENEVQAHGPIPMTYRHVNAFGDNTAHTVLLINITRPGQTHYVLTICNPNEADVEIINLYASGIQSGDGSLIDSRIKLYIKSTGNK